MQQTFFSCIFHLKTVSSVLWDLWENKTIQNIYEIVKKLISMKDSNKAQYCTAVATSTLATQSTAEEFDESPVEMHSSWERRREHLLGDFRAAAANLPQCRVRCKSARKTDIRSERYGRLRGKSINFDLNLLTSDNDRTGGFTQSSQHFANNVNNTIGGETPSHWVLNCNWRRFSWQNISVKNDMKEVNRGRAGFFELGAHPKTLSRSWNHCLHVFSRASRKVSFFSFDMIEMQRRDIGRE